MSRADISKLEKLVLADDRAHPHKDWVGKDAAKIARAIGKTVPDDTRLLLCEVDSEDHPFIQSELLMPVLGLMRVKNVEDAIEAALRAEHGFGHTAAMYSTNIDALHKMARAMDVSIFVKNAPGGSGLGLDAEGYCSFTIASLSSSHQVLCGALLFSAVGDCSSRRHWC